MIAVAPREATTSEQTASARTSTKRFYRPELDVVRFLAFVSIFLHHELPRDTKLQRNGVLLGHLSSRFQTLVAGTANAFGFGMCLFFMLSAYLIGTLLLREKEQSGNVHLRAFYVRRMLRIWPLYFFGLAIGCGASIFVARQPHDLLVLASFALMVGNWSSMIWTISNPMNPLWSISIEEQFYLVCPVAVKHLSRQGLCIFSCGLIALSDGTLFLLGHKHVSTDVIWLNSFVQFKMFGIGLLLCLWTEHREFNRPLWMRCICLAGGFTCWFVACLVFGTRQVGLARSGASMIAGYSAGTLGCLLIILALLNIKQQWLPGWMVWLGRISFGLYVYHQLAINTVPFLFVHTHGLVHFLLCFVSAAGITVLLAALSYRFLEKPFLLLKQRFEIVPSRQA